jgi:hypothetical protein
MTTALLTTKWGPRFYAVLQMALLAGCAATSYYNPNVSQVQAEHDLAQCQYEARVATTGAYSGNTRRGTSGAAGQGVAEGVAQVMDRSDLEHACLTARGYRVVTQ